MAKRPSLADSLRASLSKGVHVDTAEKIARGLDPVPDLPSLPLITETAIESSPEPLLESAIISNHIDPTPAIISNHEPQPLDRVSVTPLDGNTVNEYDSKTVAQNNGFTVSQNDRVSVLPFSRDMVQRSGGDTVKQFDGIRHKQLHSKTDSGEGGANHQTVSYHQTGPYTVSGYIPMSVLNLPYNQACVLEFLINNMSGLTNARSISETTKITIPSVREALLRLTDKGFMHKPVTVKNIDFQGFSYVLNKSLCDHFVSIGGLSKNKYIPHDTYPHTVSATNSETVTQSVRETAHSSREFLEDLKTTTTSPPETVLPSHGGTMAPPTPMSIKTSEGFILTGAVGAYWEEEGLGEGQAQKWCQQFETPPEQMRLQLEWARFDLENNGRRAEVKKDPVSWFFGHLRQTGGCFPRPVNYKSALELRAEAIELQAKKDEEAKALMAAADFESQFLKIISDPSSPQYQELFDQVSRFAKELFNDGDKSALFIEMKDLLKNRLQQ